MKHLNDILESIFDIEDNTDQFIIDSIHKFIKDNYRVNSYTISKEPVDGKYVVDTRYNVTIKNKTVSSLTNDLFRWGKVSCSFNCSECKYLTSLEGAPKEVGGCFYCSYCDRLKSLKGGPEKVRGGFYCGCCNSLTSLEGAPKEVNIDFGCGFCNSLTSLKGAPEKVGGDFDCNYCVSLTSFKGAPKEVGGDFYYKHCASIKDKTIDSKVKGRKYAH